jgi:hypothetical protein
MSRQHDAVASQVAWRFTMPCDGAFMHHTRLSSPDTSMV